MESATMTDRTLEIDGMTGEDCVKKVTGALKNVTGVATRSVKVGEAKIGADQAGCDAACSAIDAAGFTSHEDKQAGQNGSCISGAQKSFGDQKPEGRPNQNSPVNNSTAAPKPAAVKM